VPSSGEQFLVLREEMDSLAPKKTRGEIQADLPEYVLRLKTVGLMRVGSELLLWGLCQEQWLGDENPVLSLLS